MDRRNLALLAVVLAVAGRAEAALPFVEEDYPRALAEARARDLPLVIEVWAPW